MKQQKARKNKSGQYLTNKLLESWNDDSEGEGIDDANTGENHECETMQVFQ